MPIEYIPYDKKPVAGQAILGGIPRTLRRLHYAQGDKVFSRIERGIPYYDVETTEQVRGGGENLLLRGECLSACAHLKKLGIQVDLVYIDPPFASGANYAKKIYLRKNPQIAERLQSAEARLQAESTPKKRDAIKVEIQSIEQDMYGDIWRKEDYLNWMYENLTAIRDVMSHTGSIYVHLDWHIGHYVKVLLDEVFGEENFVNEIVWCYTGPGSPHMNTYNRKHDSLFWYSKTDSYVFNIDDIRVPHKDPNQSLRAAYDSSGDGWSQEDVEKMREQGKILEDWWYIPVAARSKEDGVKRTGYPTEKPEALLRRIIQGCSNEGMVVADFFGGSGVAAKVAHDLGRRFVHCDVGINSLQTARDRLYAAEASFAVQEVRDGVHLFRNPKQTMDKLPQLINGLMKMFPPGISESDWFGVIIDPKSGTTPVYVPNLADSSHKVLDEPAINELIHGHLGRLHECDERIKRVIVYYVDIEDEESLRAHMKRFNGTGIEIELRDLKQILDHVVCEDEVGYRLSKGGDSLKITRFASDSLQRAIEDYDGKRLAKLAKKGKVLAEPIVISQGGLELIEYVSVDCKSGKGKWTSTSEVKIDKAGYAIINGEKTKKPWDGSIECPQKPKRLKVRSIAGDETIVSVE